jgi:hypothetical protein
VLVRLLELDLELLAALDGQRLVLDLVPAEPCSRTTKWSCGRALAGPSPRGCRPVSFSSSARPLAPGADERRGDLRVQLDVEGLAPRAGDQPADAPLASTAWVSIDTTTPSPLQAAADVREDLARASR